jgi:excisionase family DNA binding protein
MNPGREAALLTIAQVAERFSVSERTVWRLISTGELVAIRLGRLIRIPVENLNAYIDGLP